jgi:hypothetical protein
LFPTRDRGGECADVGVDDGEGVVEAATQIFGEVVWTMLMLEYR